MMITMTMTMTTMTMTMTTTDDSAASPRGQHRWGTRPQDANGDMWLGTLEGNTTLGTNGTEVSTHPRRTWFDPPKNRGA